LEDDLKTYFDVEDFTAIKTKLYRIKTTIKERKKNELVDTVDLQQFLQTTTLEDETLQRILHESLKRISKGKLHPYTNLAFLRD